MDTVKSALFIDFDNIFIRLEEVDKQIAENFASNPDQWLAWIEDSAGINDGNISREILVRKCYLNPNSFNKFRPFFVTSAFNVVDCPPLTRGGKTSADIHMVLDIVDALDSSPGYDEFIIFSGDADFTPVLIKLREKAKRTIILSVGAASPAYKAAATRLIDEQTFIDEGINYTRKPDDYAVPVCNEELRHQIEKIIISTVKHSDYPVSMALLAQTIRDDLSKYNFDNWCGEGRFRDFLGTLSLNGLEITYDVPGYVFDPAHHDNPEKKKNLRYEFDTDEDYKFAAMVSKLTGMPLLPADTYKKLYSIIVSEISEHGFQLTTTSKNIRNACIEQGLSISRQQVNFVLIALSKSGLNFNDPAELNVHNISHKFTKKVFDLCASAQMDMVNSNKPLFKWLMVRSNDA